MYHKILKGIENALVVAMDNFINKRWYNSPLTKNIKATKDEYLEIAREAKKKKYPLIDNFEEKYQAEINKDWYHELALHTQVVIKKSDIVYVHGRLLYTSLLNYINKDKLKNINILETGTARGFSSLCMAKALEDANIEGRILTFDVLPHRAKIFWNCIDDHEGKKTRAELLKNYTHLTERYLIYHQGSTRIELKKVQMDRIHFAFLDATHEYDYLMTEFQYLKTKQQKGDIVFFDDYTSKLFPGVVKAVDEICKKYNYSKEIITISEQRAYVIAKKL